MGTRIGLLFVVVVLAGASCSIRADAPPLDGATSAQLEARAIWRACSELTCTGSPILLRSSTREEVRSELSQTTDEIEYVSALDVEALAPDGSQFPDRGILFEAASARTIRDAGIVGVDISSSKSPSDIFIRTYVFQWDGNAWVDTSADAVGVTVTSAVS